MAMDDAAANAGREGGFSGYGGLRIAADTYGIPDDPCVLLLPGGGQTRRVWVDAARALAEAGRYVVAVDLRGHGDSEWSAEGHYGLDHFVGDLRAVLAQLSSRPVIVGASLGGWIATAALGEGEPDLASGLVLVDAAPRVRAHAARSLGRDLHAHAEAEPSRARYDPGVFAGFDLLDVEQRLSDAAKRLKLPVLLVHGEHSPISSEAALRAFAAELSDAEYAEVEDAGHLVATDQKDAFNALLLEFLERRVPRTPPEYLAGSDSRTLRDALGCFGTGVTVVTTLTEEGAPVGLTANSFTSVSLDPPLLLVCLARSASSLAAFERADAFGVNVLHIGQQPVSTRFATRGEDKFTGTRCETWSTGVPIITDSLASFECRREALHDAGDHVILVGRVIRVRFEPRRDPLLYFRGKYRRLHFA